MIGCLRTRVRKQPIIALYFESENELEFYNLEARMHAERTNVTSECDLTHLRFLVFCHFFCQRTDFFYSYSLKLAYIILKGDSNNVNKWIWNDSHYYEGLDGV